jgi:hypothetical protein
VLYSRHGLTPPTKHCLTVKGCEVDFRVTGLAPRPVYAATTTNSVPLHNHRHISTCTRFRTGGRQCLQATHHQFADVVQGRSTNWRLIPGPSKSLHKRLPTNNPHTAVHAET